ncbi:MAG: arylamine N-acetyltransferase [Candidatus Marinimicrobia bacterium]|nr:arylamine N-acetyltransferase [Candidatus Neomarinimicrobiota bacterium]
MKTIYDIHLFSILHHIPYENISKILRLKMNPKDRPRDSKTLLSDHHSLHFGGTCFSLVNLVVKSLQIEGIKAYPVKADIHRRTFPHFFAIAEYDHKYYLIDPGYLINKPLEIRQDRATHQKNGAIDFNVNHLKEGQFQLQTHTNGQQKTRYTFHVEPLDDAEFLEFWIHSFDYMNAIVASRFIDNKFIYINGNYVQIRSKGNIEKYDQKEKALHYLKTYFDFDKNIIHTANILLQEYRKQQK